MGALLAGGLTGLLNQSSAQVIDGSLKFQKANSTYLIRTPSSAGNRSVYTGSVWVKRTQFAPENNSNSNVYNHIIFSAGTDTTNNIDNIRFYKNAGSDSNAIEYGAYPGSYNYLVVTNAKFRDPSGWYNVVWNYDGTTAKIYINGVQQTDLDTNTQNGGSNGHFNNNVAHVIGRTPDLAYNGEFDGYMSQFHWIDGLSLGPGYFGFIDPLTNTWRPKKFRAEGTTVNDGTVWSSYLTTSSGSIQNTANAFDGDTTTYNNSTVNEAVFTFTPPTPIRYKNSVRIWLRTADHKARINGGTYIFNTGAPLVGQWMTLSTGSGLINTIDVQYTAGSKTAINAIEVDGVIMIDSTTTNLAFGTNGFYLPMDGNSPIGEDKSGNGNNWTPVNFSGTSIDPDVLKDSPSGAVSGGRAQTGITTTSSAPSNYATLNPLHNNKVLNVDRSTLSDGNLVTSTGSNGNKEVSGTIGVSSGKWYFELTNISGGNNTDGVGIADLDTGTEAMVRDDGAFRYNGSESSYSASWQTSGDVIGVKINLDNSTIGFFKNGIYQGDAKTDLPSVTYHPYVYNRAGAPSASELHVNFGQKPFKYAPPVGFSPLNSASATPETVITRPNQYMNTVTYTGTGSDLTLDVGFKPDLSYFSVQSATGYIKYIFDSVRGATKYLATSHSQGDDAEGTSSSTLKSFNANGVTIGNNGQMNENSSNTWVSWHWKAGGNKNTFNVDDVGYASAAAAGLTGGNIAPTGASVGTRQGFSIIKYTGNGQNSAQGIPHGLGKTPSFVMTKALEATGDVMNWRCYHQSLGATQYIQLNTIDAPGAFLDWANTSPTSQYFYVGGFNATQPANEPKDYISYFWSDIPGLQKFGKFIGNASADGNFIELGFRPALVWIKPLYSYDGGTDIVAQTGWYVYDNKRETFNPNGKVLALNSNRAEEDNSTDVDFLSNGFKLRNVRAVNTGQGSIYCAWAEAPTFNLYGAQSNAR